MSHESVAKVIKTSSNGLFFSLFSDNYRFSNEEFSLLYQWQCWFSRVQGETPTCLRACNKSSNITLKNWSPVRGHDLITGLEKRTVDMRQKHSLNTLYNFLYSLRCFRYRPTLFVQYLSFHLPWPGNCEHFEKLIESVLCFSSAFRSKTLLSVTVLRTLSSCLQ